MGILIRHITLSIRWLMLVSFSVVPFMISFFDSRIATFKSKDVIPSQVTLDLGNAWADNTVNTAIFRQDGMVTQNGYQFTAFYVDEKTISIVKRKLNTNQTERYELPGDYELSDSHNAISIGIDLDGYLHLAYQEHVSPLHYRISLQPYSIDQWSDEQPMTGVNENQVTYPSFVKVDNQGKLLFLYRHGYSGKGALCIKEYSTQTKSWKDNNEFIASGLDGKPWKSNPYWNTPVLDQKDHLHLSFVWRTDSIGEDELVNNIGIDYAWSPDLGMNWYTSKDVPIKIPITQVNSETIYAVSPGTNLMNQTSMAVDSKGRPHIVYYSDDQNGIPQYQHLWFDGKGWQHSIISSQSTDFSLLGKGTLPLPMARPEILIDKADNVFVIYQAKFTDYKMAVLKLSAPNYEYKKTNQRILLDEPLGYAEPIVDRTRWKKENILSMLIQYNNSPDHDSEAASKSELSPIKIIDWDLLRNWK